MQEHGQNNRKKILFIITKSVWGGAGKYVYDLAANLPKEKFESCVAAGGQDRLSQELKKAGVSYYEIKNFQRDIGIIKEILSFFEVFKLIKNFKPDIIHANSSKAGGIAGAAALIYKLLSTVNCQLSTVVFTAHGWAFNESRPKWQIILIKFFSRLTCFFYGKIVCVSEFDRKSAIKNKIAAANKLVTIHNGVDAREYKFLTKKEALENLKLPTTNCQLRTILIGTIGEFTKNKGQKYLIDAVSKLSTVNCQLLTVIVGWGKDEKSLKLKVKGEKLEDKVFIINNLSPAGPYLKAFDIFVLPSLKEGLPYTLLEAGLAELPVIATNAGGNPEIIEDKKTGLLINPANSDEIALTIKNLIDNPELAKNLASNLRQKILQEFSLEKMVKETLEVYDSSNHPTNSF